MTHPSSLVLESFAVGEPLPAVHAAHVATCATCAAFLDELRGLVSSGPSAGDADAAVARALAGLGGERVVVIGTKRENDAENGNAGASRARPSSRIPRHRRNPWRRISR